MINYLSLIHRVDFNNLYKFGQCYVHTAIPFDGNLARHANDDALFESVTAYMNIFEYSSEYLLVHFSKQKYSGATVEILIKDVVAAYALDESARKELMASFDSRIVLNLSPWADKFRDLNKAQLIRQAERGAVNIFEIFAIKEDIRGQVFNILSRNALQEIYDSLFSGMRPSGAKSIWVYLSRYNRHAPYCIDNRGFLLDAVNVFENHKAQQELFDACEIVEATALGSAMENCGNDIVAIFEKIDQIGADDYKLPETGQINFLKTAMLFLLLKKNFNQGLTSAKLDNINSVLETARQNMSELGFAIALGLLGYNLGQRETYSCYYEKTGIGLFKNEPIREETIDPEIKAFDAIQSNQVEQESDTLETNNVPGEQLGSNQIVDSATEAETTFKEAHPVDSQTSALLGKTIPQIESIPAQNIELEGSAAKEEIKNSEQTEAANIQATVSINEESPKQSDEQNTVAGETALQDAQESTHGDGPISEKNMPESDEGGSLSILEFPVKLAKRNNRGWKKTKGKIDIKEAKDQAEFDKWVNKGWEEYRDEPMQMLPLS